MANKDVRNGIFIAVATSLILSAIGGLGLFMKAEITTYYELKKAMPEIKELNQAKKDLLDERAAYEKKINNSIWKFKERLKDLEEAGESEKDKEQDEQISNLRRLRSRDSSHIYWNHHYVKGWVEQQGN